MKSLVAAIAFLTRLPVGGIVACDAVDVARSGGWFPLVGIIVGAICCGVAVVLRGHLPDAVTAILLVVVDILITGGLHYDGLADCADGFGGGALKEDVLRIMRDHAIGSYGGLALVAVLAFKVTAYSALLGRPHWMLAVILTPALGRWAILPLTATLPYARETVSVIGGIGKAQLAWATVSMLMILGLAHSTRAGMALLVVALVSAAFGSYCRRRISGITGDTLGANVELSEAAALLVFLWAVHPI